MKTSEYEIGDRVIVVGNSCVMHGVMPGMVGTVMHIESPLFTTHTIGVRLDKAFGRRGYNLNGRCEAGYGIYMRPSSIELYEEDDDFQEALMTLIGVAI